MIIIKSPREIEIIKKAGKITALTLEKVKANVAEGVKTKKLDKIAEKFIKSQGAIPAFKGYKGYPANITVAINEEVVHGIPGSRKLLSGDIIGIDVGVIFEGYYADAAITVPVGNVKAEHLKLIEVTKNSLYEGIKQAKIGNRLSDISHAVQSYVESFGFSIVRDLTGHGIGRSLHEDPQILNYGPSGEGPLLEEGMVLAIEPMVNLGDYEVGIKKDNWTIATADGSFSAHFEHTIAVAKSGPEILTQKGSGTDNLHN